MPELTVMSGHVGGVYVSEELVEFLGAGSIDDAITHLRLGGGSCWACEARIHHTDDVSLAAHKTPAGARVGFIHFRCGPPQLRNDRRNRRAAIAMDHFIKERFSDVQAFVAFRNHASPQGVLVVSPGTPLAARADNDEAVSLWLDLSLGTGLIPIAPKVLDTEPGLVEGWSLRIEGPNIVCQSPRGRFFEGKLETPEPWLNAISSERRCLVLAAGLGVNINTLRRGAEVALDLLASQGLVAGGAVRVDGLLGNQYSLGDGGCPDPCEKDRQPHKNAASSGRVTEEALQRPGDPRMPRMWHRKRSSERCFSSLAPCRLSWRCGTVAPHAAGEARLRSRP